MVKKSPMKSVTNLYFCLAALLLFLIISSCQKNPSTIPLTEGLIISESTSIVKDTFRINGFNNLKKSQITIEGENIVVDFQGANLIGSNDKITPDKYYGSGILIKGKDIEIKNLTIRGYKFGILAEHAENLRIINCNFEQNYRPKLRSNTIKHSVDDNFNINLSKYKNQKNQELLTQEDEWLRYGAAIYLKDCKNATIKNTRISNGNNGILLNNCSNSSFYNNFITYNSGYAFGLKNSTENQIMHNQLDWNIRGFSFNHYNKSTGSGGIFSTKDADNNIIAFNSIRHSGKNTFRSNQVYKNDFFPFSEDSIFQKNNSSDIAPLVDGKNAFIPSSKFEGEKHIIINPYGPYNFAYPNIVLREVNDDKFTFSIFGPEGNWKIVDGEGFLQTSRQSGSIPATVVATREKRKYVNLKLEFIGVEFEDTFGKINRRGKTFPFEFNPR